MTDEAGVLHKVYVVLVQVISDNLGLNGLHGYVDCRGFYCQLSMPDM